MSGFASLLNQFKETTQAATAGGSGNNSSKRSRSSFESSSQNNYEQPTQKSKIRHPPPTPPPTVTYCYPSSVPVKTIYIACPANTETGGPEALHQLCHMLNTGGYYYHDNAEESNNTDDNNRDEFGRLITNNHNQVDSEGKQHKLKAYMLYLRERSTGKKSSVEQVFGDSRRSPRPTKYNKYNAPMTDHRFPSQQPTSSLSGSSEYSSDLVIWPECWTHLIDSLQTQQQKYQIAVWWLSVNNNKGRFTQDQFSKRKDILHLVQSTYAHEYVESKLSFDDSRSKSDVKDNMKQQQKHVLTLTEFIPYTSSEFALGSIPIATEAAKPTTTVDSDDNIEAKPNLVVYNPAKGMHFTDEIIRRACGKHAKTESDGSVSGGGIRFCPIGKGPGGRERMTGEEVVGLLKKAKVVSNLLSLYMLIKLHFFSVSSANRVEIMSR
jgi:hypothetical protein